MKKLVKILPMLDKSKYLIGFFIVLILFSLNNCGTIVDDLKLVGTWELTDAQFYQYNAVLDTYKIIQAVSATSDNSSDENAPVLNAVFFDTDDSNSYQIDFSQAVYY
ncbi:MAG: hypothetical protein MJB14_02960, partial [Spirochaetes bacterium]|nr:hypothetical protein [Spirochaetota bacterium]